MMIAPAILRPSLRKGLPPVGFLVSRNLCPLLLPLLTACGGGSDSSGSDSGSGIERHRIFEKSVGAHSEGVAGPFATSPDGRVLWVSEGGSLYILEDATDPAQYSAAPAPVVALGRERVQPVEMALDPAATSPYGDDLGPDLLYIAAGRFGLWGMRAIEDPSEPAGVTRIDDRQILDGVPSDSRRWCAALEFLELEDEFGTRVPYLLALFSGRDESLLRLYELEAIRNQIPCTPEETGCELSPVREVRFGRHPGQPDDESLSYGFGLTRHPIDPRRVDVYLALGAHGLGKLRLRSPSPGEVGPIAEAVEWGPVFGDGTPYADDDAIYDHLHYYYDREGNEYGAQPPLFTDLQVVHFDLDGLPGEEAVLLATVDHLGWVAFDVTDGLWDSFLPVAHHEGERTRIELAGDEQGAVFGDEVLRLAPEEGEGKVLTWARRLSVAEHGGRKILAVTSARVPMAKDPGRRADGTVLGPHFDVRNGILADARTDGSHEHTTLYELDSSLLRFQLNQRVTTHSGGEELKIFPHQVSGHPDQVEFYAGHRARIEGQNYGNATLRQSIDFRRPLDESQFLIRSAEHRVGHFGHVLGSFKVNPDVLLRSHNDSIIRADGTYVHCGNEIERIYDTSSGGDDNGGSFGIFLNPKATWPADIFLHEYVWGAGRSPQAGVPEAWTLYHVSTGTNVCEEGTQDPPEILRRWHFHPPTTRFGTLARNYWTASLDEAYDQQNDAGLEVVFATCGGDPHALYVFDRGFIQEWAELNPGELLELDNPDFAPALLAQLVTDPEYESVPDSQGPGSEGHRFLNEHGLLGRAESFSPHLFRLPSSPSSPHDTWVMAAPCGAVYFPPDLPVDDSLRPADVYLDAFGHSLVRFWRVQDPRELARGGEHYEPFAEILGPTPEAAAIDVETAERDGRVLAFVADHGGKVLAYDVTDLLHSPTDALVPLDVWEAPFSLWDHNSNTLRSIVVDRATWTEGDTEHDELVIYAGIQRIGVQALVWDDEERRFLEQVLVQTPGNANYVELRIDDRDTSNVIKTLLVADGVGVRILGYGF